MKDVQTKNPPLKYLIYSELVTMQKGIRMRAIMSILVLVGSVVIQLSMTYGNLGKYKEFDGLVQFMPVPLVWLVSMLPIMFIETILESSNVDTRANWIKFRLSTPVSALRLALAKYLTLLGTLFVSTVISVIGLSLLALFGNDAITAQNVKIGFMLGLVMFILIIVMQVAMLYFRSQDKSALVMLGVIAMLVLPLPILIKTSTPDGSLNAGKDVFKLLPILAEYFPIVVIAAAAVFIIGFAMTVIIFKRRER